MKKPAEGNYQQQSLALIEDYLINTNIYSRTETKDDKKNLKPKPSKAEKTLIKKYGMYDKDISISELDISETISELSYLTHSYYRYYGKFPSKLASHFLNKYAHKKSVLLDNYVGSGTSLVEAKLMGIPSYGIDINPTAVLASNVKTTNYDISILNKEWLTLYQHIQKLKEIDAQGYQDYIPEWNALDKWFSDDSKKQLASLKKLLLEHDFNDGKVRDFFLLGFLSIIRRVSRAYDGEVRPHINKEKKERNVYTAYSKKMGEMITLAVDFNKACKKKSSSKSFLTSNLKLDDLPEIKKAGINLILSHPPYLNCFDYLPVYVLELNWAVGIESLWNNYSLKELKELESKCWPATSEKILYGYFDALKEAYSQSFKILKRGGICGVVIGDATIHKELIRVHLILASICENIGYELIEIIYRSTHYGTGKYAYKHRADYHGESMKKDCILVFKKS